MESEHLNLVFNLRAKQKRGTGLDEPLSLMSRPTAYIRNILYYNKFHVINKDIQCGFSI